MIVAIKNKQDLLRAIGQREFTLVGDHEVVNDADLKAVTDKIEGLLRQQNKLHVVFLKRS